MRCKMAKSRKAYIQKAYTSRRYSENFAELSSTKTLYENLLCNIVSSTFIWDVPEELSEYGFVNSKYIENNLLNYKLACAKIDSLDLPIMLPFNAFGEKNIYGEFSTIQLISPYNGMSYESNLPNFAILSDYNHGNIRNIINYYSNFFTCIDMLQNLNLNVQKTPYLITASDESMKLALKNVFADIEGYKEAISIDKFFDKDAIQILNLNAPFLSDKLQDLKSQKIIEFMMWIGIPVPFDKKERVNNTESLQNLALPLASIYARMENRKLFCEQIKKRLNLDFNVRYNDHILNEDGFLKMFTALRGGEKNVDNEFTANSFNVAK